MFDIELTRIRTWRTVISTYRKKLALRIVLQFTRSATNSRKKSVRKTAGSLKSRWRVYMYEEQATRQPSEMQSQQ